MKNTVNLNMFRYVCYLYVVDLVGKHSNCYCQIVISYNNFFDIKSFSISVDFIDKYYLAENIVQTILVQYSRSIHMHNNIYFNTHLLLAKDYEISRQRIDLGDILGEGQFGDVHKGSYKDFVSIKNPLFLKTIFIYKQA